MPKKLPKPFVKSTFSTRPTMATYKIVHPTTNKVVNLYSTSASGSIANGARLLLYNWENNNDQKWELETVGGYAIFRIARDRNKVMNRHSTNNNAHVWHYDGSYATQQDSVVNTETTNGNMRIKLVHRNLYLTKNANDNYLSWAAKIESNRQYFKMEEVAGGGTVTGNILTYPCTTMRITQNYNGTTSYYNASHGSPADYPFDEGDLPPYFGPLSMLVNDRLRYRFPLSAYLHFTTLTANSQGRRKPLGKPLIV